MHSFPIRCDRPSALAMAVLATMHERYFSIPETAGMPLTARAIAQWTASGLEHIDDIEWALADLRGRGWVETQHSQLVGKVWALTARGTAEAARRRPAPRRATA